MMMNSCRTDDDDDENIVALAWHTIKVEDQEFVIFTNNNNSLPRL